MSFGGSNLKDAKDIPQDPNSGTVVEALQGLSIEWVSCGDYHCAAVDSNGNLYTWGGGKSSQYNKGQCGHGLAEFCPQPTRVEALAHKKVEKVSCGAFHTLILT